MKRGADPPPPIRLPSGGSRSWRKMRVPDAEQLATWIEIDL
jgi:hypothetical protein